MPRLKRLECRGGTQAQSILMPGRHDLQANRQALRVETDRNRGRWPTRAVERKREWQVVEDGLRQLVSVDFARRTVDWPGDAGHLRREQQIVAFHEPLRLVVEGGTRKLRAPNLQPRNSPTGCLRSR